MKIPFNRPYLAPGTLERVQEAFLNRRTSGAGRFTDACERRLEEATGCERALLVTSCTHALEMCALLLNLGPGDEVIIPSFTFVSTANAFVLRGARPVFVDVREDTLNLDESLIQAAITPKTRAIVVVHYAGVACEMDAIRKIAAEHGLPVIEDNAHGLFGTYRGQPLGSLGSLATLSFHETKNVSSGEGGALLLNDSALVGRAEILREKGTNRSSFFRGETQKYTWVDLGSSYVQSEILAGVLLAALECAPDTQRKRQHAWETYASALRPWAERTGVRLPEIPEHVVHPFHLFHLRLPSEEDRNRLIQWLAERDIAAVFHYLPLNDSEMAARIGSDHPPCPIASKVSKTLLRLPIYNDIDDDAIQRVVEAVVSFR